MTALATWAPQGRERAENWTGSRPVFSPDGKMMAMNGRRKPIALWETSSGKQRLLLKGHEEPTTCVAFSADGGTLASASWDSTIRLWDLETGKELRKLMGHRGPAWGLSFSGDGNLLVSAGEDTTMLFWDVAAVTHRPRPRIARLSLAECEAVWKNLADRDAAKAYGAITKLTAATDQAVTLLQAHLEPARPADAKRLADLIRDLDDRRFAVREKATRELGRLGDAAAPALHLALQGQPALELRRRAEALLEKLATVSGERLRGLRAVEVLEHIGTPAARQLLRKLATGLPEARVTQEAKASLGRLARQAAAP
jgi:hypothetical protein